VHPCRVGLVVLAVLANQNPQQLALAINGPDRTLFREADEIGNDDPTEICFGSERNIGHTGLQAIPDNKREGCLGMRLAWDTNADIL